MKRILILTACLLSGLAASDPLESTRSAAASSAAAPSSMPAPEDYQSPSSSSSSSSSSYSVPNEDYQFGNVVFKGGTIRVIYYDHLRLKECDDFLKNETVKTCGDVLKIIGEYDGSTLPYTLDLSDFLVKKTGLYRKDSTEKSVINFSELLSRLPYLDRLRFPCYNSGLNELFESISNHNKLLKHVEFGSIFCNAEEKSISARVSIIKNFIAKMKCLEQFTIDILDELSSCSRSSNSFPSTLGEFILKNSEEIGPHRRLTFRRNCLVSL